MAQLIWKERYSVGIKELDVQHKGLLELVNELSRMDPNYISTKDVFTALHTLVEYAQNHFDTEELYLKKYNYPKFSEQHREHVAFTETVFLFAQRLEKGDTNIHKKIVSFIMDWYISHILGDDQEYKLFFYIKGVI